VPENLPEALEQEAKRTVDFYRALGLLRKSAPEAAGAAAIFARLYREQRNDTYALNLLSARVVKLLTGNLYRILQGDDASQARLAIREAEAALPNLPALSARGQYALVVNLAALLLATGQAGGALRRLSSLDNFRRDSEVMALEAVAHHRLGEHELASALIQQARARFGALDEVVQAEAHIQHSSPAPLKARLMQDEVQASSIREAFHFFYAMSPARQAAVLTGRPAALEYVFTETFRDALAAFERSLSFLRLDTKDYHEDDYTGILGELVQGRVDTLFGWQAHEQSPGGFTDTELGGSRRRDVVIRRGGVDIAAIEAVKALTPTEVGIVEHLHKLFSYSKADIGVHLTYSRRPRPGETLGGLRNVAPQVAPGSEYVGQEMFAAEGARPAYIRAAYRRGGVDFTVLFFVVDIPQIAQRSAGGAPMVMDSGAPAAPGSVTAAAAAAAGAEAPAPPAVPGLSRCWSFGFDIPVGRQRTGSNEPRPSLTFVLLAARPERPQRVLEPRRACATLCHKRLFAIRPSLTKAASGIS
jgi:hypothetical protein